MHDRRFLTRGFNFGSRACPGLRSRTRAAAIFVDELDAVRLSKRLPNDFKYRAAAAGCQPFRTDGSFMRLDSRPIGEHPLTPSADFELINDSIFHHHGKFSAILLG